MVINGFKPYEFELIESEYSKLDTVAEGIGSLLFDEVQIDSVEIVGHSAIYGTSDFQATSEKRASVVEAELQTALDRHQPPIDYTKIPTDSYGVSTKCPVAKNNTRANRAKNRRVEIWVHYTKKPDDDPSPDTSVPNLRKLIKNAQNLTTNPSTKCIAKKLLKKKYNHEYISKRTVKEGLNVELSEATFYNYLDHMQNMRKDLKKFRLTIANTPTNKSPEIRFNKFLKRQKNDLIKGIKSLTLSSCNNPILHSMRRDVLELSEKESSFYSCEIVKQQVEEMLHQVGGSVVGCGKGY
jgi:hypothetical protein